MSYKIGDEVLFAYPPSHSLYGQTIPAIVTEIENEKVYVRYTSDHLGHSLESTYYPNEEYLRHLTKLEKAMK